MSKTYVKDSTSVLKKVLLCPPTYFEFEPINVITEDWLEKGEKANKEACMREHAEFAQAYRENGVEVVMMDPNPNCTYEVFARDFGACLAEGYIMGNFREPCRKPSSRRPRRYPPRQMAAEKASAAKPAAAPQAVSSVPLP